MRKPKKDMEEKKDIMLSMAQNNPKLSITVLARQVRVSQPTASKWLEEAGYKRWF